MESRVHPLSVAEVNYPTLRGSQSMEVFEGESFSFGRGGECKVRFGHVPTMDSSIPRVAGTLSAVEGRVVINSSTHVGHRALEIHEGAKKLQIPIGSGISLRGNFDVVIRGESRNWVLGVSVHTRTDNRIASSFEDPSTAHVALKLTSMQWKVLRAYYDPILRGSAEPATHQEVAELLGYHLNTVRNKIYEIRDLMYINGLQMLDTKDARVAVVEAARIHGLIEE